VKWSNGHVEHEHDILHASLLDKSGLQAQTGGKRRMTPAYHELYISASAPVHHAARQDLQPTSSAELIYGDAKALKEHAAYFLQVQRTMELIEKELEKDVLQVAANKMPTFEAHFNSLTTLGISFVDMKVEEILVGGPAFLNDQFSLSLILFSFVLWSKRIMGPGRLS